jgi:hypothetical protein
LDLNFFVLIFYFGNIEYIFSLMCFGGFQFSVLENIQNAFSLACFRTSFEGFSKKGSF